MKAVKETTVWNCEFQPNHIYLMDGDRAVAYIRQGTSEPQYFSKPMRFDLRGRKFEEVSPNPFNTDTVETHTIKVQGSKGQTYEVDTEAGTCTCPGYTFRGQCRHVAAAQGMTVLDGGNAVIQNVATKAKKRLTSKAKGAIVHTLSNNAQRSKTNCREEDITMSTEKLFTVVGTSTFKGQSKVRFTNDIAVRIKTLVKGGHTNVELIELPRPMTKAEAVAYLEANTPKGIDMAAVSNKSADVGRRAKAGAIKTPVSKKAKAPAAEQAA